MQIRQPSSWPIGSLFLALLVTPVLAADTMNVERDIAYLGPGRQEKGDLYRPAKTAMGAAGAVATRGLLARSTSAPPWR
jgi:hypothetical protein